MRNPAAIIIAFACLALATAQSFGLHIHVETDDRGAGANTTHVQHHLSDHHDHDSEVDASKLELGNHWLKSLPAVLVHDPRLALDFVTTGKHWSTPDTSILHAWRLHWRPPLRAPPILS